MLCFRRLTDSAVIPGRRETASFDVQLHIRESITTIVSMLGWTAPNGIAVPE